MLTLYNLMEYIILSCKFKFSPIKLFFFLSKVLKPQLTVGTYLPYQQIQELVKNPTVNSLHSIWITVCHICDYH